MEKRDTQPGYSWIIAFIVSGTCYLAFSGFMELLNNGFPSIFMWVGMISMSLGCLLAIGSVFFEKANQNTDQYTSIE